MKPFNVQKLPIEYNLDKELLTLLSEANLKYGEYKSYLKNLNLLRMYIVQNLCNYNTLNRFLKIIMDNG